MKPQFVLVGGRVLHVNEIKWAGIKGQEVYVEFRSGGWTVLAGVTLEQLNAALNYGTPPRPEPGTLSV